jgi:hypothetical protein
MKDRGSLDVSASSHDCACAPRWRCWFDLTAVCKKDHRGKEGDELRRCDDQLVRAIGQASLAATDGILSVSDEVASSEPSASRSWCSRCADWGACGGGVGGEGINRY